MNDFKDGLSIVILCTMLAFMLLMLFVLPFVALAAIPGVAIYIGCVKHRDSPTRKEAEARDHLARLYEQTKAGTLAAFSEEQIQYQLGRHMPGNAPANVEYHLKAVGRRFLDQLDLVTEVPAPPLVANSIEGGRYQDLLAKIGTHSPDYVKRAVDDVAEILGYVARFAGGHSGMSMVPVKYFVPNMAKALRPIIAIIFGNDAFKPAQEVMEENLEGQKGVMPEDYKGDDPAGAYFDGLALEYLFHFDIPFAIPDGHRVEHHQVVASPGHGKTSNLINMVLDDLESDAAIVVIDSQGDLIESLATRIPADRLILIDPATCPPALNIFASRVEGEKGIADALELYNFIFASSGQPMTGKQTMVYRQLSRLCMAIPGASIHTLRALLMPGGTDDHQAIIETLGDSAKSFFIQFNALKNNQYKETAAEILVRLDTILIDGPFSRMVGAKTMRLNIPEALQAGKVILVNTNVNLLKEASPLVGRIFIGQVLQAVRSRSQGNRRRVYLYCDEFGDYAGDQKMLTDCFSQGRKYGLAMVVCFQLWHQLPSDIAAFIAGCTAIKFAGGVSANDIGFMAKQMGTDTATIHSQPKGTFLAYFKDIGVMPWKVEFGRIDRTPEVNNLRDIQERMRIEYGDELPRAEEDEAASGEPLNVPSSRRSETAPPPGAPPPPTAPDGFKDAY